MSKDPAELFKRVDAAACYLLDNHSTPFLVVLTREEFMEYVSHYDAPRWFTIQPSGPAIRGLPIRLVRDKRFIPKGLVYSKTSAQVAFSGEYG